MTLPYAYVNAELHERRERVFILLAGLFLGTMTMLNILGISRFIKFTSFTVHPSPGTTWEIALAVAVGVLPYPLTFLCTDFISEFYGRRRANYVVWVGLVLNVWVVFILWLGGALPGFMPNDPATGFPPQPAYDATKHAFLETGWTFYQIRALTFGAVMASMCAYMAAQFCDVFLFHFWKNLTKGKHLWLRNNGSTMVSQMVDTVAVILITHFYAHALPLRDDVPVWVQLLVFISTGYAFKFVIAALDTIPFYIGVHWLSKYLQIDPHAEHDIDAEEATHAD
ncbi:MAG: queuosine precursor transporter [Phycisphaera sp.]|nr:queuosine precursor transporter [Phycisphaera sp.]